MLGAVSAGFWLIGCHTITEELPSQPSGNPASPTLSIPLPVFPIPGANPAPVATPTPTPGPAPTPTPSATPTPTPTPEPTPEPPPPSASGCGSPLPPPVGKVNAKIHIKGPNRTVLDSTPLVGPDPDYCRLIGYTDGRRYCPTRLEGHPERGTCDAYVSGRAADTGRGGPTWTRNGAYCTGYESTLCENDPGNQFLLIAYGPGIYKACVESGVCGEVVVP